MDTHMSVASVDRCISRLKCKYDEVQKLDPGVLPKRVHGVKDLY
jgi:hypothetical protein